MIISFWETARPFLANSFSGEFPQKWFTSVESLGTASVLAFFLWERMRECARLKKENKRLLTRINQLKRQLEEKHENNKNRN